MLPTAYYLLKVIICSAVLFGYYWLALRNKIFHQYNRFYLLAAVVLSLLLPVIKINFWDNTTEKPAVIKVLQAVSDGDVYLDNIISGNQDAGWTMTQWASAAYFLISLVLVLLLFQTLFIIYRLIRKYPRQQIGDISFVNTDAKSTPFSFLNYIFWNSNIDAESATGKQIFKHEVAHIQEKHTYDKLFMNMVLSVFWCNPIFWLLRRELNMIHEFIADKKAVEDSDTAAFAAMILQAAYPQHQFSLANNFFYSPIKRRLAMLTKNKNPKVNYWGRVLVLPVALLLFAAFTFKAKNSNGPNIYTGEKIKVIIDAGHGGIDKGAKTIDGGFEKDINLEIAKTIQALNTNNAIEIILSRNEDVTLDAKKRVELASSQNADIFISFHTDASVKADSKSGMEVCIPKDEAANAGSSKILASAIINEFSGNYALPVSPLPIQRQQGIWVLKANTIPAVLIQTGSITNSKDLGYLRTNEAKTAIARNLLQAIEKFAAAYIAGKHTGDAVLPAYALANMKYADTSYLKSAEYKTKALLIINSKEIGNVGMSYIEDNNIQFSSITVYDPSKAKALFGMKGKYGVIDVVRNAPVDIIADSALLDPKTQTIKLTGKNTKLSGNLSDAVIFIDNIKATPGELEKIDPGKIQAVNIVRGEQLKSIPEAKDKTGVIYVTLKPAVLEEVKVTGFKTIPDAASGNSIKLTGVAKETALPSDVLYVVDGEIKDKTAAAVIKGYDIQSVDVLKGESATQQYGEKGKNGVIKITTKPGNAKLEEVVVEGYPSKKAVTKSGEIYIGALNKIFPPAEKDKYDIMMNISNGSISGTDDYYITKVPSSTGLLRITVLKKGTTQILYNLNFKAVPPPDNTKEVHLIKLDDYMH